MKILIRASLPQGNIYLDPSGRPCEKYLFGLSGRPCDRNTYMASGPVGCLPQIWKFFFAGRARRAQIHIFIWVNFNMVGPFSRLLFDPVGRQRFKRLTHKMRLRARGKVRARRLEAQVLRFKSVTAVPVGVAVQRSRRTEFLSFAF